MSNEVQKEQPSQGNQKFKQFFLLLSKMEFPEGVFALLKAKTGSTGKLALGIGVGALLLSKEIYVVTNEVGVTRIISLMQSLDLEL